MSQNDTGDQRRDADQNPLLPGPPDEEAIIDRAKNKCEQAEEYQAKSSATMKDVATNVKRAVNHTIISTYIMCVLTGAVILVSVRQCSITNDQLEEMKAASDAAREGLKQGNASLDASIEASRTDQRAWLGIKTIDAPTLVPNQKAVINFRIENSGRTPAIEVRAFVDVIHSTVMLTDAAKVRIAANIARQGKQEEGMMISTIFPDSGFNNMARTSVLLGSGDIESVKNGKNFIIVVGEITYRDIFKETPVRHTRFFAWYNPEFSAFQPLPKHNEAD